MRTNAPRLDPFQALGTIELALIAEHLPVLDVIRAQLVSRTWRHVLNSQEMSKIALLKGFPYARATVEFRRKQAKREMRLLAKMVGRREEGGGREVERDRERDGRRDGKKEKEWEEVEDADEEEVDARLLFRRCVYRLHTRRLGCPTTLLWHILENGDGGGEADAFGPEWDVAGGYVAWIGDSGSMLNVQNIRTGHGASIDYKKTMMERRIRQRWSDPKVNMQIGDNVVCATLNFYNRNEDGFGSGRAALFMLFKAETLEFLWHCEVAPPYGKILGEVDTSRGHLSYIRKRPKPQVKPWQHWSASGYNAQEAAENDQEEAPPEVHFVVHDLMTGELIRELHLERGHEIAMGDIFFIVVSDSAFRRLVVLYQPASLDSGFSSIVSGYVCARIYSIDDEVNNIAHVLETKMLSRDPSTWIGLERKMGTETDIYMDYPPRIGMFDIAESVYAWARLPSANVEEQDFEFDVEVESCGSSGASTRTRSTTTSSDSKEASVDSDEASFCSDLLRLSRIVPALNAPIIPPSLPYHTWNICTSGDAPIKFTQTRYISELSRERDFFTQHSDYYDPEASLSERGPQDICRRFEVFLPVADASVIFSNTSNNRFKCEVGIFEEAPKEDAELWTERIKTFKRRLPGSEEWPLRLPSDVGESEADIDPNDTDAWERKYLRDGFRQAGLDPDNLLVPVTQTYRQTARRPMTTRRLTTWKSSTTTSLSLSPPSRALPPPRSSSLGAVSTRSATESDNDPIPTPRGTYSGPSSGELVPYEISPTGEILLKGEVGSSFLHLVQWTDDYLAVQNRWTVDPALQPQHTDMLIRPQQRHAVVIFDFSAPW